MTEIPCCIFHTKLLILDDNKDFIEGVQFALSSKNKSIGITNINAARDIIFENKNWVNKLLGNGVSRAFDTDSTKFAVEMDISSLHKVIYDPNRFNHIAILIIDYDMPDMNGLNFIRSLGNHRLKIIMLTGKAGQDTVIKAFNDNEIHRYVSKGEPDYLQIISKYVGELENEFFIDFSKFLLDSLKSETEIFDTSPFQNIFHQVVQENNIVEYYLLDESGSFLLLDATAENQIWLLVKSKNDMRLFYELAVEDPDTPAYVIKKLKNQEAFTHFKTEEESHFGAKYWNLIDCKPLDEKKEFYYAILKNDDDFKIDLEEIKSYADFINEQE